SARSRCMDLIGCRHLRFSGREVTSTGSGAVMMSAPGGAYDLDEAPHSVGSEVDDRGHQEPSPRWRKFFTRLGVGLGGLVVLYVLLMAISWIAVQPRDDIAFFEPRPGEHRPLVFAHQGGEGLGPENTQIAFGESLEIGADVLDTDVHMTRDGVLVLIHDETVDRTSDGSGEVRDLSLSELRQLDFGYSFTTDDGTTFPYRGTGQGILTVEEMFSEFADTRFGIEIKQTAIEAPRKLCTIIQDFGYEDRVLISSSGQTNMDAFRESCPGVATSATSDEARWFYIFQFIRLPGFYSPPFDSLQVPEYEGGTHVLTSSFVSAARSWNLPMIPWTIDELEDFDRIIDDYDVDGINTNHPDRLVGYLEDS
ncbi:MAG: glycerophosphodiester phosphodiesterase, partial [Acidimicrobiales bacterium]